MNVVRETVMQDTVVGAQVHSNLRRRRIVEKLAFGALWAAAGLVVIVLFFVIAYLLVQSGKFFVGAEDLLENARIMASSEEVRNEVAAVPGALGYLSMSAADETVKLLTVNGVAPTPENVADGRYPVVQTLYFVTQGETSPAAQAWLELALSAEGQAAIAEVGFVSMGPGTRYTASSEPLSGNLLLSGDASMVPLAAALAARYGEYYPGVTPTITLNTATAGIRDVGKRTADIALSSRPVRDFEIVRYDGLDIYAVAQNGIVVIAHPDLAVSDLTINRLRDAFTGAITNWQAMGGPDAEVIVVSHDTDAGEREGFQKWVLSKDQLMARALRSGNLRLFSQSAWATLRFVWRFLLTRPLPGMGGKGGISTTILTTIYMVLLTLAIATPVGVGGAIYLVEYAGEMSGQSGVINKVVEAIRFAVETLAGVPSIIYGLFGFAFFVTVMQLGLSMLSGALAGACLILPTIIRTTEEALLTVPRSYREGSLALGATKWQTNYRVVLPAAMPGIVTGVILGVGRVISETAVFYVTLGGSINMPQSIMDQGRTMVLHLYLLMMDSNAPDPAMGTAIVIVVVIIFINLAINSVSNRMKHASQ